MPQSIIDKYGQPLDSALSSKAVEFMWSTIERGFSYSQTNTKDIPSSKSLYDYFKEELEKTGFNELEKETCLEVSKMWGAYIGSPIERQSMRFFFLEECLEGCKSNRLFKYLARTNGPMISQSVCGIDL